MLVHCLYSDHIILSLLLILIEVDDNTSRHLASLDLFAALCPLGLAAHFVDRLQQASLRILEAGLGILHGSYERTDNVQVAKDPLAWLGLDLGCSSRGQSYHLYATLVYGTPLHWLSSRTMILPPFLCPMYFIAS